MTRTKILFLAVLLMPSALASAAVFKQATKTQKEAFVQKSARSSTCTRSAAGSHNQPSRMSRQVAINNYLGKKSVAQPARSGKARTAR